MTAGQENVDHGRELKGHTAACLTGMILCITPPDKMAVQCSTTFYIQVTSAELNELNTMSSLNDYAEPAGENRSGISTRETQVAEMKKRTLVSLFLQS